MKKFINLALVSFCAFALMACGGSSGESSSQNADDSNQTQKPDISNPPQQKPNNPNTNHPNAPQITYVIHQFPNQFLQVNFTYKDELQQKHSIVSNQQNISVTKNETNISFTLKNAKIDASNQTQDLKFVVTQIGNKPRDFKISINGQHVDLNPIVNPSNAASDADKIFPGDLTIIGNGSTTINGKKFTYELEAI